MKTRPKKFDCVRMKDEIQAQLMAEYESRRGEFASYVDFINAKADASPWARKMRRRAAAAKRATAGGRLPR